MEISAVGKVQVTALVENLEDRFQADAGVLPAGRVRHVDVPDALVDTGAVMLSLPSRMIAQLGLRPFKTRRMRTTAGVVDTKVYSAVRLTVHGREVTVDVAEVPDDCPALIGQIPLEGLDLVVDPIGQRLIGNPDHGGEHRIGAVASFNPEPTATVPASCFETPSPLAPG